MVCLVTPTLEYVDVVSNTVIPAATNAPTALALGRTYRVRVRWQSNDISLCANARFGDSGGVVPDFSVVGVMTTCMFPLSLVW